MGVVSPMVADIYEDEVSYRASVSEAYFKKLASSLNAVNYKKIRPIGSLEMSYLPLAKFQLLHDTSWVLVDGSTITSTDLGAFMLAEGLATGSVVLPDLRGQVPIGVNNGRSDGKQNQVSASLALGGQMGDGNRTHQHYVAAYGGFQAHTSETALGTIGGIMDWAYTLRGVSGQADVGQTTGQGQVQTTVNSVGVNWFVKVWNNPV
jgi:hypothetical protein